MVKIDCCLLSGERQDGQLLMEECMHTKADAVYHKHSGIMVDELWCSIEVTYIVHCGGKQHLFSNL